MSVKKISEIGSDVIRSKAAKVEKIISRNVKKIVADLTDTMRHENLVGIAAPQIGIGSQIFVTEVRKTKLRKDVSTLDPLRVFINPALTRVSKKMVTGYEGCGSVAHGGLFGIVKRPEVIAVRAHNENGEEFELETGGLLARIIQHEIDHLNGICFIDRVTDTKKLLGREEYIKLKKS
jgi:peptide deformylase